MVQLIAVAVFICLSAFFSASETAVFSLSGVRLRRLRERSGYAGRCLQDLVSRPTRFLTTVNFGNMIVNTGMSSIFTAFFVAMMGDQGLFVAIPVCGFFMLILGEVLPKNIAIYRAENVALFSAPLLWALSRLGSPLAYLIERVVAGLSVFMGSGSRRLVLSPQELRTAIEVARQDGLLTQGEKEMINYILEFKETWVSDILTARIDIEGISVGMTQGEVLEFLKEKKHSKLPVYEGSLDNIIGVLYAKELFLDPGKDYRRLLRQPLLVPASRRIDDLLKTFLETQERMAVVLDEYGGTAGLVTLEDVQEEIFGEIYGEFETPRPDIEKIGEGFYRVNARSPVKNVNLTLDLGLPDEEVTVAGFILSRLEKIPRSQEKLRFKNAEFIVERATARRIITVLVKIDGRS